jgi:hypothetical protein
MGEQQWDPTPITASITPLTKNRTHNPQPTFTFDAKDKFKPNQTTLDNLVFQVDTWEGPWVPAVNTGSGHFEGRVPAPLSVGIHILYAYASDGQEGTSTNTAQQSSPLIGSITSYVFLVY